MAESGRVTTSGDGRNWRQLCAAASKEPDSEKLVSLVNQIIQAFDDEDDQKKSPRVVAAFSTDFSQADLAQAQWCSQGGSDDWS